MLISACDEAVLPTSTAGTTAGANASNADLAPVIKSLSVDPQGDNVLLTVKATDPSGTKLSFKWTVSRGVLAATTSPSVFWKPGKDAGTAVVSVEVTNAKGARVASQNFTVAADGTATSTGDAVIQPATPATGTATANGNTTGATGTGTTGTGTIGTATGSQQTTTNGQFQIPSPVPSGSPLALLVSGVPQPVATLPPGGGTVIASPTPQVVVTPVGPSPTPTPAPPQPVATPTPTPAPPIVPSPTPVPSATPTAAPGVPVPPASVWVPINSNAAPAALGLKAVHFPIFGSGTFNNGWAVGGNSAVIRTTNGGQSWTTCNTGVPVSSTLDCVYFTSDAAGTNGGAGFNEAGFIAGAGLVMRSTNLGTLWEDISPPQLFDNISTLIGYNAQIVMIATRDGRVLRNEGANNGTAANVSASWTVINTKPTTHPQDSATDLRAGACFGSDNTLAWFAGDAIYRYDKDNPNPDQVWVKVIQLDTANDGFGTTVAMPSQNEIWVGTTRGRLFRSMDGGNSWTKLTKFFNREHNGNNSELAPTNFMDISVPTSTDVWGLLGLKVLDAANATITTDTNRDLDTEPDLDWRSTGVSGSGFNDIQVQVRMNGGVKEYFGWGVGYNSTIQRLVPSQ